MAIELKTSPSPASSGSVLTSSPWAFKLPSRGVSSQDRAFFTERLALLLETGNPLHTSLNLLIQQTVGSAMSPIIEELRDDVETGKPFSQGLAKHPAVFSTTYVSLVAAAEGGGFLPRVLTELTAMEEKTAQLKSTIVSSFTYPAFLVVFSSAVVLFVLAVVFPKFSELFSSIAGQLPPTTLFLMVVSDILRQQWPLIAVSLIGVAGACVYWLNQAGGARALDRWKLRLPVLEAIFVELYLTQSMRVIGLSLGHGVSVPDTLKACRDVVRNQEFREFMDKVAVEVNEGRGLSAGFEKSYFLPPLAMQMVAAGEESGNLPLVATRIADFYERELTRRLNLLAKLIEPIMLLVMGVVVGLIVASLILPIFKLSRAVH